MYTAHSVLSQLAAIGFVGSLAAIGLASHDFTGAGKPIADVVTGAFQSSYETGFAANNPLDGFASSAIGALRYGVFGQAETGAIVGHDGWLFTTEELEQTAGFDANIAEAVDRIAWVDAQLDAQGITLLPVLVADKAEIYADSLGVTRPARIVERRAQLREALAAQGIRALDTAPVLRNARQTADVFMKSDTHWAPHGSRAVAAAVAGTVAEMDLDLAAATVATQQQDNITFDGDLLRFVPTGKLRPLMGPEQEFITRFSTEIEAAGGLFDDTAVDVALVGTSFSARPDWHFAGFLQNALGAELINVAQEGRGPFEPMTAFLASETYHTTPLKLVIWEIPVRYTSKDMKP